MKQFNSVQYRGLPAWYRLIHCLCLLGILAGALLPEVAMAKKSSDPPEQFLKGSVSTWRESKDEGKNLDDIELSATFPDKEWWHQFNDQYLDAYIQEAFKANHQLQIAIEKIHEAEGLTAQSLGRELPSLAISPTFARTRNSKYIIPNASKITGSSSSSSGSGSGSSTTSSSGGSSSFLLGQYINSYSLPLVASYEPDFWLKNRDRTRSAKLSAEAMKKDFQTTALLLATNVATAYFNLIAADELIEIQNKRIELSQHNLDFAQARFQEGVAAEDEVALSQGTMANERAKLQTLNAQKALALNSLAVLLGRTTQQVNEIPRKSFNEYQLSSKVDVGVPSELLTRRPDILAAEQRLQAANIDVRVARKDFLPSFTLTGQFGFAAANLGNWMKWNGYMTSLGTGLSQSIFSGGQKKAALKIAKSRYEQAVHNYQQTVLQAFREVDDALASYKANQRASLDYQASAQALDTRAQVVSNRLDEGVVSEADLALAQLDATTSQTLAAQAKLAALTDTLSLYKSVGGGY